MPQSTNARRIDELKARKRDLLAQRESIIAEMEAGTLTDKFPLFFCNEEIRAVNAQLRASAHRKTTAARHVGDGEFMVDKRLYSDWLHSDTDDDIDDYHAEMKRAAAEATKVLTPQQAFYYARWADGISITDIASSTGVDKSTVSRSISRAKARIRQEFELRHSMPEGEQKKLDLADEDIMRLVLSLLTPYQAVCLYLYYGEWLSLRDCAALLSVDHSTVYRTIQRGLTSICKAMNCRHVHVENIDVIGDLAYESYAEHAESINAEIVLPKAEWKARVSSGEKRKEYASKSQMSGGELRYTISVGAANGDGCDGINNGGGVRKPGKLLGLLMRSRQMEKVKAILLSIFKNLQRKRSTKCITGKTSR